VRKLLCANTLITVALPFLTLGCGGGPTAPTTRPSGQVDVVQSRDKGGTGLGLAIVKHIVNRHRGHLEIVSEPGQGARFTVAFPEAGPGR